MTNIDDLNKIFSFKDAVKTVENILDETRTARDKLYNPETGMYSNWDAYYALHDRAEAIEDVLTALTIEQSIMHHVRTHDEREVTL